MKARSPTYVMRRQYSRPAARGTPCVSRATSTRPTTAASSPCRAPRPSVVAARRPPAQEGASAAAAFARRSRALSSTLARTAPRMAAVHLTRTRPAETDRPARRMAELYAPAFPRAFATPATAFGATGQSASSTSSTVSDIARARWNAARSTPRTSDGCAPCASAAAHTTDSTMSATGAGGRGGGRRRRGERGRGRGRSLELSEIRALACASVSPACSASFAVDRVPVLRAHVPCGIPCVPTSWERVRTGRGMVRSSGHTLCSRGLDGASRKASIRASPGRVGPRAGDMGTSAGHVGNGRAGDTSAWRTGDLRQQQCRFLA